MDDEESYQTKQLTGEYDSGTPHPYGVDIDRALKQLAIEAARIRKRVFVDAQEPMKRVYDQGEFIGLFDKLAQLEGYIRLQDIECGIDRE